MIKQAYKYLSEGYFEDAIKAFSDGFVLEEDGAKAYYGRGAAYFQIKKWKLAVDDFKKAKELDPQDADAWLGLAISLVMDHKIYEAIGVYDGLIAFQPGLARAHIQLGLLYYRLGAIAKGHRCLDRALASRPSLGERKRIEELREEQLALDKKRYYRPDFEALRNKA